MDSNSEDTPGLSTSCVLCLRILTSENDTSDFGTLNMCSDCKFLLLEDLDSPMRDVHRWRSFGSRRRRYNNSAESIESLFSQQFSHMINLARQNQESILVHDDQSVDGEASARSLHRSISHTTERDGIDSVFAESELNVSFSGYRLMYSENETLSYGGSSDGSSLPDVENSEVEGSDVDTDTDIDPMRAGMYHWDSDDQEEDDNGWQEEITVGVRSQNLSTWGRLSIQSAEYEDADYLEYLDGHDLDDLVEHIAEADGLRRGAPPAAVSVVNSLPRVVIKDHGQLDSLACAICKELLFVGSVVNQLPCSHLYHPSCILPWLSSRNTCPLCRYELPTDDQEYEDRKQMSVNELMNLEIRSSEAEAVVPHEFGHGGSAEQEEVVSAIGPSTGSGRRSWCFLAAAAPVISVVSIALMLWLGSPLTEPRRSSVLQVFFSHGQPSSHPPLSDRANNRDRRWWCLL